VNWLRSSLVVHTFQAELMSAARLVSKTKRLLEIANLEMAPLGLLEVIGAGAGDEDDPPPDGDAAPAAPAEVGLCPGAVVEAGVDGGVAPVALTDTLWASCC